jgi:hypothetical protein
MLVPLVKIPKYVPDLILWFGQRPIDIAFMQSEDFEAHETKVPIEEFNPEDPDFSFIREIRPIEIGLPCDFSEFMRRCRIKHDAIPDRFTIHGQSYLIVIEDQPMYGEHKVGWNFSFSSGELHTVKKDWGTSIMRVWAYIAGIQGFKVEDFPDLEQPKQRPFRRRIA